MNIRTISSIHNGFELWMLDFHYQHGFMVEACQQVSI